MLCDVLTCSGRTDDSNTYLIGIWIEAQSEIDIELQSIEREIKKKKKTTNRQEAKKRKKAMMSESDDSGRTEMQVEGNPECSLPWHSIKNCTWTGEGDKR